MEIIVYNKEVVLAKRHRPHLIISSFCHLLIKNLRL